MKTQVIQLDPHDDVISIRDKIAWAKTPRVLLVFPKRSHLRLRNLDLRLLRRHASLLGAQLALVSRSKDLRRLAREEGLPSFRSVSVAQRKRWEKTSSAEMPQRRSSPPDLWQLRREVYSSHTGWQELPAVRIGFFTLAVLTVLVLLVLFLPSASVHLSPTTRLQTLSIPVNAGSSVATVNLAGSLPARSLSMFVERSQTAPATGSAAVPEAQAEGSVRFSNLTNADVFIPAGTIVRTITNPAVRFATTLAVTVPAAPGKPQDVSVKAVSRGTPGNLPKDSLVAIEGSLGVSLAVTNPAPTTGGTDRKVLAPSTSDRSTLRDALEKDILNECKTSFQQTAGAGALLFPDSLAVAQVAAETYLPAEGQAGNTLSLTLNLQCRIEYASSADIHSLAAMGMDVTVPAGFETVPEAQVAVVADTPVTDAEGVTHWRMQAQRLLRARVESVTAVGLSQGRSRLEASRRLMSALPLEASPRIAVNPSWWPWLPVFPFRISVSLGG